MSHMQMRAYVATNWMTVTDVLGYFTYTDSLGKTERRARVIVDNNGGPPFETVLPLTHAFSRLIPASTSRAPS